MEKEKNFEAFAFSEPKPTGTSKFITVPVIRGFSEIAPIYSACGDDTVICGGYVRYMASPKSTPIPAGDVDLFPKEEGAYQRMKEFLTKEGFEQRHENNVSLTFNSHKSAPWKYCPTIQVIKPVKEGAIVTLGSVEDILNNFDFTVVRAALISPTEATVDADFPADEENGILRLKNIHCPISSTLRCMKYARKGYFMRPMEVMKLFADWDGRTQEYRNSLYAFFLKSATKEEKWTQEEVDQLEALLRID